MDKKQPLISIVTACFNSENTIEQTFKSVLYQSYSNLEYIVIDGNSTDKTVDLIKKHETIFRDKGIGFKWLSEKDKGIYDAMNKGLSLATGELIGIINSDDHYEERAIEKIVAEYLKDQSYDVYHGLLKYYDSGKLSMIKGEHHSVLPKHMIEHPTCFLKKTTYEKYGVFNCKYKFVADYELLCRIKKNGGKFKLIEEVIASFYDGGAGDCIESVIEAINFRYEYGYLNKKTRAISQAKIRLKKISKLII